MISVNRDKIAEVCQKYSVTKFSLFGSATTDKFNEESDVDVLISFDDKGTDFNYFDVYFRIKSELELYWNRSVDLVVDKDFTNPYFKESLEKSKVLIYER